MKFINNILGASAFRHDSNPHPRSQSEKFNKSFEEKREPYGEDDEIRATAQHPAKIYVFMLDKTQ